MSPVDQVRILPSGPGVYRFRDRTGRVIYLGRATSLRSRVGSYFAAGSFASPGRGNRRHLRRMIPQVDRIEALLTASVHEASWLERNLHHRSLPRWNRTRGGAEVPQLIRVVTGAHEVSVSVCHLTGRADADPGAGSGAAERLFGPYLGGQQVRSAVTGLSRVWPVGFAGDRLTGAEQDLAAVRGISSTDRDRLAAGLLATLSGAPDAVAHTLTELARRRDAAAAAESFELAGRVRDEMAAVEWVTAVQRVARLAGADLPVHHRDAGDGAAARDPRAGAPDPLAGADAGLAGWADGVLVTWTVRAGRLDGWAQRRCGARAAQPHLDATDESWRDFAATNAELAARLLVAR